MEVCIRHGQTIKSRQWWLNNLKKIKRLLLNGLAKSKAKLIKKANVTLLITDDKEIRSLNKKYRRKDKPTDVLAFQVDGKYQETFKELGDIVISAQTAKREAKDLNIAINKELLILLTHGYLHLIGYDHKLQKDAKIMFKLQKKIINKLQQ